MSQTHKQSNICSVHHLISCHYMPHDKLFLPDKPKSLCDTSYLQNRWQAAACCLCRGCGFCIRWRTSDTASNSCLTKTGRGVSAVEMLPKMFLQLLSLEPQIPLWATNQTPADHSFCFEATF